jgi:hypothetical protein
MTRTKGGSVITESGKGSPLRVKVFTLTMLDQQNHGRCESIFDESSHKWFARDFTCSSTNSIPIRYLTLISTFGYAEISTSLGLRLRYY